MSENLELLAEGIAAYNRGDLSFVFERAADDIEVFGHAGLVNPGTYRGRDEFERWTREWQEAWSEITLDVRDVREVDERFLVVEVHQAATGRESGIPVEMDLVQLIEARDGEIARFHLYPDLASAREALETLRT